MVQIHPPQPKITKSWRKLRMQISQIIQKLKSKKIIAGGIALAVVIVLYFIQVFCMGVVNQKFYENAQQSFKEMQSDLQKLNGEYGIFSIQNESFERGFFTSKASFDMFIDAVAFDAPIDSAIPPIKVIMEFKNNIFSSQNVIARIENPFHEMLQMLASTSELTLDIDRNLVVIKVNVSLFGNANIQTKINDINFKASDTEYMDFKDFISSIQVNGDGKVVSETLHFGGFEMRDNDEALYYIKGVDFDTKFDEPVSIAGAIGYEIANYDSRGNIQSMGFKEGMASMEILDTKLDIKMRSQAGKSEQSDFSGEVFSVDSSIKARSLDYTEMDFKQALQDIDIQVLFDRIPTILYKMAVVSRLDFLGHNDAIHALLDEVGTKIEIGNLSFHKDTNDFNAKGFVLFGGEDTEVNCTLTSNVQFNELFPEIFNSSIVLPQNNEGRYTLDIVKKPKEQELKFNDKGFSEFFGEEMVGEELDDDEDLVEEEVIQNPDTQNVNPAQSPNI